MSLTVGERLGPYEIVGPLGAGGMGEVYRAHDPRLGREVAIKVLPADLSDDPERLRRFEQEARAASALNHPNLLTVFDIGSHAGAPFIVFELLEGETLRQRIGPRLLPPKKALEYAVQIARGLGAAHEQEIVHRDLKPENVFVTKDGRVKILDFGLAKLRVGKDDAALGSEVGTKSMLTGPGTVLGTAAYMSPEQVQGRPADHRSDIFSLGTVTYEMLAGQRPFSGDSAVQTMSAILEKDPPSLTGKDVVLPPTLEAIVLRCLEKRPEDRFRSARDIAFALEAIGMSGSAPVLAIPARGAWARRLGGLSAAFAAGLLVMTLLRHRLPGADEKPPASYTRLTFQRGIVDAARFARDGHTVVYSAAWNGKATEVFSARLGSTESRGFDLAGAKLLALSSNDEMAVAVRWHQLSPWEGVGTLAQVSLAGGSARELVQDVVCADWAPDGQTLAVVRRGEEDAERLEFPIGNVLYKLRPEKGSIMALRVSPQAERVAFLEIGPDQTFSVAVVNLAAKRQTLSTGWNRTVGLAWTRSGDEVWFTGTRVGFARALYAVSLKGRERLVARVPGPLTLQDLAPDGRVLLTQEDTRREMAGLLAGDVKERDLSWLDYSWPHDLSADGHRVLFAEGGGTTRQKPVLFLRTDAAPPLRLGEIEASANARLSPDGQWVLLFGASSLERMPTGAGPTQQIPIGPIELPTGFARFFPDGKRILVSGHEPGHRSRTYVVDVEGGVPRPITPEGIVGGPISPDSEWLHAVEASTGKLWVFPIRGGDPVPIKGQPDPESQPLEWSPDGRSQWRFSGDGLPGRISRFDAATGREEAWKELMPADPAGIRTIERTLITPDGRHYVYSFQRVLSDLYLVEGLN